MNHPIAETSPLVAEPDERAALRRAVARLVSAVLECACIRGLPLPAMIARVEAAAEIFEEAAAHGIQ